MEYKLVVCLSLLLFIGFSNQTGYGGRSTYSAHSSSGDTWSPSGPGERTEGAELINEVAKGIADLLKGQPEAGYLEGSFSSSDDSNHGGGGYGVIGNLRGSGSGSSSYGGNSDPGRGSGYGGSGSYGGRGSGIFGEGGSYGGGVGFGGGRGYAGGGGYGGYGSYEGGFGGSFGNANVLSKCTIGGGRCHPPGHNEPTTILVVETDDNSASTYNSRRPTSQGHISSANPPKPSNQPSSGEYHYTGPFPGPTGSINDFINVNSFDKKKPDVVTTQCSGEGCFAQTGPKINPTGSKPNDNSASTYDSRRPTSQGHISSAHPTKPSSQSSSGEYHYTGPFPGPTGSINDFTNVNSFDKKKPDVATTQCSGEGCYAQTGPKINPTSSKPNLEVFPPIIHPSGPNDPTTIIVVETDDNSASTYDWRRPTSQGHISSAKPTKPSYPHISEHHYTGPLPGPTGSIDDLTNVNSFDKKRPDVATTQCSGEGCYAQTGPTINPTGSTPNFKVSPPISYPSGQNEQTTIKVVGTDDNSASTYDWRRPTSQGHISSAEPTKPSYPHNSEHHYTGPLSGPTGSIDDLTNVNLFDKKRPDVATTQCSGEGCYAQTGPKINPTASTPNLEVLPPISYPADTPCTGPSCIKVISSYAPPPSGIPPGFPGWLPNDNDFYPKKNRTSPNNDVTSKPIASTIDGCASGNCQNGPGGNDNSPFTSGALGFSTTAPSYIIGNLGSNSGSSQKPNYPNNPYLTTSDGPTFKPNSGYTSGTPIRSTTNKPKNDYHPNHPIPDLGQQQKDECYDGLCIGFPTDNPFKAFTTPTGIDTAYTSTPTITPDYNRPTTPDYKLLFEKCQDECNNNDCNKKKPENERISNVKNGPDGNNDDKIIFRDEGDSDGSHGLGTGGSSDFLSKLIKDAADVGRTGGNYEHATGSGSVPNVGSLARFGGDAHIVFRA